MLKVKSRLCIHITAVRLLIGQPANQLHLHHTHVRLSRIRFRKVGST